VIDGEIIAYSDDGRPSFNVLQNYRSVGPELHLYAWTLQSRPSQAPRSWAGRVLRLRAGVRHSDDLSRLNQG
jgi:hypothetical protein